ncbi:hypothetical protein [Nocardia sp. NPDC056000]|uniref:hypothetical protein n=1 Tax=Nocardia sp. NPDC056000 TaxID=3345674 RepID=UPI0035E02D8C
MTGMEVVVGMVAGWLVTKANRAAGRLDEHSDQAVDAAVDRLWGVVSRKLHMTPVIQQLTQEAETGQPVSASTRQQVQQSLEQAASSDPGFAAELAAGTAAVEAAVHQARVYTPPNITTIGGATNTGTVHGGMVAGQFHGPTEIDNSANTTINKAVTYANEHPQRVLFGGVAVLVILLIIILVAANVVSSSDGNDGANRLPGGVPLANGGVPASSGTVSTTAAGTATSGILVHFTSGKGSNGIRNKETVGYLDPKTGQYQKVREFDIAGWTGYFYSYELVLSPTLDRFAMSKAVDGQGHAGWVDSSGRFTDVTAGQKPGPFEQSYAFDSIGFGRNGDFYYSRVTSDRQFDVYRLPAGATSGGQFVKTLGPFATVVAWREADGSIGVYGAGDDSAKGNCEYAMTQVSWVSATTYVIANGTQIAKVTNTPPDCPKVDLLPATNQATVTSPVVSADGKRLVFTYNGADLYIVDTDGGKSPVQLQYPKNVLHDFQVLRWT